MPTLLPPLASTIRQSLPRVHFLDAFALPLPGRLTATEVARAVFQQAPAWVVGLMRLRNAVVRRLGLRSTAAAAAAGPRPATGPLRPGDWLGPFQTFSVTPTEVILGLDDRHLDFRVSVLVEPAADGQATGWVSTVVRFHNLFGRLYFALVRPFHALVVPGLLRTGQRRLGGQRPVDLHPAPSEDVSVGRE